jgi:hypothetical protein
MPEERTVSTFTKLNSADCAAQKASTIQAPTHPPFGFGGPIRLQAFSISEKDKIITAGANHMITFSLQTENWSFQGFSDVHFWPFWTKGFPPAQYQMYLIANYYPIQTNT